MNISDHLAISPLQFSLRVADSAVGYRELGIGESDIRAGLHKDALIGRLMERMESRYPRTAALVGGALDAAIMVNEASGTPVACYLLCPEADYDADTAQVWVGGLPTLRPELSLLQGVPDDIVNFAQQVHDGFLWSGEGSGPFSLSTGLLSLSMYTGGVDPNWLADEVNMGAKDLNVAMSNIDSSVYYCWKSGGELLENTEMIVVDMYGDDQHIRIGGSFEEEADTLMSSSMVGDLIW
ncbi:hypothetical protein [Tsukamurella ocularis]|uniref:hypothetical protein n=1 Tax=Tsukamurella ocularis TaxID=1970234 RepID=UPI0021672914|nr:hypothetical protein [Tsukamurella ocularis]MCS3782070.1 hypothetical protein [Tsukamurella ocularis]MCS3788564.1 hypothetical protein [Tsukamurella ocularis]MCS3852284.1 hypothetical protein [Tsukamurella ocularis]